MDELNNKKQILISKCMEHLSEQLKDSIPENGSFQRHCIFFTYPGTTHDALLWIENAAGSRYFCVGVKKKNDDRLVQHYMKRGTNDELAKYLQSDIAAEEISTSLEQLSERVDDLD